MSKSIYPKIDYDALYHHNDSAPAIKPISENDGSVLYEVLTGDAAGHRMKMSIELFHAYLKPGARIKYVVGFMFSRDKKEVVLVRKNRPKWQEGLLNGVGGHVNTNENDKAAMEREFAEEAGHLTDTWRKFHVLRGKTFEVSFFATIGNKRAFSNIRTMTDEPIRVIKVEHILNPQVNLAIVPNLSWLIPMALDPLHISSTSQSL